MRAAGGRRHLHFMNAMNPGAQCRFLVSTSADTGAEGLGESGAIIIKYPTELKSAATALTHSLISQY